MEICNKFQNYYNKLKLEGVVSIRVLIVFGTRTGSTKEISIKIKEFLEEKEIYSDIFDLSSLSKEEWPSVNGYNGVIVASSIKGSFWRDEPKHFLRDNGSKILKNKKILGTFVCSAYSLVDKEKAKEMYVEKILNHYKIHPHIYEIFGPVLDFSEDSKLNTLDKKLLKLTARNISEETGIQINENIKNDFRNWEQIKKFADGFSQFLLNKQIL